MTEATKVNYGSAIRDAFSYLLSTYPEVIVLGQGLWSPWYVGNSMTALDTEFGKDRVIDTPVSEAACTGVGVGAAIAGMKPIVVHPRMDFMLYAIDPIVNQAAKWSSMFGGQSSAGVTIRSIINRGGEQGAQHSQALHGWFAHVPGLRVVMPYSVPDARDLLIASVLCPDPVLYIDDRWLYEQEDYLPPIQELDLSDQGPQVVRVGADLTVVSCGYSTKIAVEAASVVSKESISVEVIDLRILNPLELSSVIQSVSKTRRLIVVDGGWAVAGISAEVIAKTFETIGKNVMLANPARVTIPFAPAPSSSQLEAEYYPTVNSVCAKIRSLIGN